MGIEETIKQNNDFISPRCLFNNELRYRVTEYTNSPGKQFCALSDNLCAYYKRDGAQELCMNYDTKYK